MLTKREPSHAAHFEYCPIFGARTASCSTVLRGEISPKRKLEMRAFRNDQIRPLGIRNLKHALRGVLLISS
jgi:hypothetical protein